ncbi:protein Spindly [Monomorium pharaonis]|uniref:protein Spindly n=1 Tax=Monomorium pharaonis TaxID=307658 RepID=UPI00063F1AE8|nr:protein Spindly [Monomorium pharaonis]XP_036142660.1 protein Spindly [Monomorium pharaonis]XP_036142661.1 protein Spindly [Monomorium pharaonis]XP_036142662.1 protein Spindly [Monomorium pharaonis]
MSGTSELYSESVNDTKIEEALEKSSKSKDDYKRLKQENENYRQELHDLRRKLETSEAFQKDLQESYETIDISFKQYIKKVDDAREKREEMFKTEKREYKDHIEALETNLIKSELDIKQLQEELKEYKDLVNKQPSHLTAMEDTLTRYKEEHAELIILLEDEKKKFTQKKEDEMELRKQILAMAEHIDELEAALESTKLQLIKKTGELEELQETVQDLAMNLMELKSPNTVPASETCKGNSLFAEVEDRRQMLMDKMKVMTNKYNETKRALNVKIAELNTLRAEKFKVTKKWEADMNDTLQEKEDLLNKYKSRIFDLEKKLKVEMKKNEQEEIQLTEDSFNYAQTLLTAKTKELKELKEKCEKQAMQLLVQDETNHRISVELRFWRAKTVSLEAQILNLQAKLEKIQQTNDNFFDAIEDCNHCDNVNVKRTCDDTKFISDKSTPENNTCQENSEMLKKPVVDSTNEQRELSKKCVNFTMDTTIIQNKSLRLPSSDLQERQKKIEYPIISFKDDTEEFSVH